MMATWSYGQCHKAEGRDMANVVRAKRIALNAELLPVGTEFETVEPADLSSVECRPKLCRWRIVAHDKCAEGEWDKQGRVLERVELIESAAM